MSFQSIVSGGRHGELCFWDIRQRQLRNTIKAFDATCTVKTLTTDYAQVEDLEVILKWKDWIYINDMQIDFISQKLSRFAIELHVSFGLCQQTFVLFKMKICIIQSFFA